MGKDFVPFECPSLGKAFVLLLDPVEPVTQDLERWWEPDEALWLFYGALDGRTRAPLRRVFNYCRDFSDLPPVVSVLWALWHPQTPFGVGYRLAHVPGWSDVVMYVLWRGQWYMRDRQGVLTPMDQTFQLQPTPREWWEVIGQVLTERREREARP